MNPISSTFLFALREQRSLLVATSAIVVIGWLGDFLFWHSQPGVSVGLFVATLAAGLWMVGKRTLRVSVVMVLLLAAAAQTGVELCFTNIACLVTLTVALSAEVHVAHLSGGWARWSESFFAIVSAPLRWIGFMSAWSEARLLVSSHENLRAPTIGRFLVAIVPAAVVALVFAALLSAGNAVLAEAFARIGTRLRDWALDISFARTALWLLWLTVGLAFYWPVSKSDSPRWWTRPIPLWQRSEALIAQWQSGLILAAVNVLFFAANTADAIYLWADARLPAGVTASRFVHTGVYALIAATILAGGLLTLIFQQQPSVARSKWLRVLALAWIAQNIVLITGVCRRLALYVEAYQLSELRVYVGCFLLLVSVGFALLARHVWLGVRLERLIFSNAIATFALFFTLQFCDVGTWVANWNVTRWKAQPGRALDVEYLSSLGSRGWPALAEIARSEQNSPTRERAVLALRELAMWENTLSTTRDWRAYQMRRDRRAEQLIRTYRPEL